jgi:hypothetical protein
MNMRKLRITKRKRPSKRALNELTTDYGMFDQPGPVEDDEEKFGLEDVITPVVASEQVATQLSVDRPPVDDPDYVPSTIKSLSLAVAELAKTIPEEQIHAFYKQYQGMVEKIEMEAEQEIAGGPMSESKTLNMLIKEAMEDEDIDYLRKQFEEEFGADPEDTLDALMDDSEGAPEPEAPQDETSLKDIANETGFAGPSGVKNFLYKLLGRVKQFSNIPDEEFDALIEFGVGEYLDLLEQSGSISGEDAKFMAQNKSEVANLPSYKYFLFHAMVLPAAKAVEKQGKNSLNQALGKLNLPPRVKASMINQLVGEVPRNHQIITDQLQAAVKAGQIQQNRADELADELANKFRALQTLAVTGDDFAEMALQRYAKLNKKKLMGILKKASNDANVQAAAV